MTKNNEIEQAILNLRNVKQYIDNLNHEIAEQYKFIQRIWPDIETLIAAAQRPMPERVAAEQLKQVVHPDSLTYFELATILHDKYPNGLIIVEDEK